MTDRSSSIYCTIAGSETPWRIIMPLLWASILKLAVYADDAAVLSPTATLDTTACLKPTKYCNHCAAACPGTGNVGKPSLAVQKPP